MYGDVRRDAAVTHIGFEHDRCYLTGTCLRYGVGDIMRDACTDDVGEFRAVVVAIGVAEEFIDVGRDEGDEARFIVYDDHGTMRLDGAGDVNRLPIAVRQVDLGPVIAQRPVLAFLKRAWIADFLPQANPCCNIYGTEWAPDQSKGISVRFPGVSSVENRMQTTCCGISFHVRKRYLHIFASANETFYEVSSFTCGEMGTWLKAA
ncbi:hypothetical protein D3C73_781450 [compost metagenome]